MSAFCALCTSDVGPFIKRPFGKGDAFVDVCAGCDTDHPNTGRYSFGGGRTTGFAAYAAGRTGRSGRAGT